MVKNIANNILPNSSLLNSLVVILFCSVSFSSEKKWLLISVPPVTVNDVFDESFRLTIIPHTMKETLFKNYKKGLKVNVETDMFARYVSHIISHQSKSNLTWDEVDSITALY